MITITNSMKKSIASAIRDLELSGVQMFALPDYNGFFVTRTSDIDDTLNEMFKIELNNIGYSICEKNERTM